MTDDVAEVNEELKSLAKKPARKPFKTLVWSWTPVDEASWLLGWSLGLFPDMPDYATFRKKAGPRWTTTPLGNGLYDCLKKLVSAGVLQEHESLTESSGYTERDFQYRWKR